MNYRFYVRRIFFLFAIILFSHFSYCQATDDYRTFANGNWNSNAIWQRYNGTNWVNINGVAPNTIPGSGDGTITIRNTDTIAISANITIDQTIVEAGGQIRINSIRTLTIANGTGIDLIVNGAIDNIGTITTTGTLFFNANSTYKHNRDGGTIPNATWDVSSSCIVTGVIGNAPGGLSQTFGDFTWNCTGQSSNENLDGNLTLVDGDFTIASTGTGGDALRLTNGTDLTFEIGGDFILSGGDLLFTNNIADITVNVKGSFIQTGGTLDFSNDNQIGILILNVAGDFSQSGGSFDFASGGANTTRSPELNLSGNFLQTGSATITTSSSDADIVNGLFKFNKNGTQTFFAALPANISYVNYIVNSGSSLMMLSNINLTSISTAVWAGQFTINSGGLLNTDVFMIESSSGTSAGLNNSFTFSSGAKIISANTYGIQNNATSGSISTAIANRIYSSGGDYEFKGSLTGTFITSPVANTIRDFTVNEFSGSVTLSQPMAVTRTFNLNAGILITSLSNLLTINDNATSSSGSYSPVSYVAGPMKKIGDDTFTFPVGKSNVYAPASISAPSSVTAEFRSEYFRNVPPNKHNITAPGLNHISSCEYWDIEEVGPGNPVVDVSLSWSGLSPCSPAVYINDLATLTVAHYNGNHWNSHNNDGGISGNAIMGNIKRKAVSSFSIFTIGSTSTGTNPLTVKLTSVKAYQSGQVNKIEWTNNTELGVNSYEIEKSTDGVLFVSFKNQTARMNTGGRVDYIVSDENPGAGISYYRIKAVENNNDVSYSLIAKVIRNGKAALSMTIYPNPVTNNQFSIQLNNSQQGNYLLKLLNMTGQEVYHCNWHSSEGSVTRTVELPSGIQSGLYLLHLYVKGNVLQSKVIIR